MPIPGPIDGRARRARALLLSLFVTVGLLAACGDGDDDPEAVSGPGETSEAEDSTEGGGAEHGSGSPVAPGAREIQVAGRSFAFDPDEISIEVGEDVAIVLTSEDSLHDVTVDEVGHVAADAGETAAGGFRVDEPGRYDFYCSVPGHREAGMEGVLVVEG